MEFDQCDTGLALWRFAKGDGALAVEYEFFAPQHDLVAAADGYIGAVGALIDEGEFVEAFFNPRMIARGHLVGDYDVMTGFTSDRHRHPVLEFTALVHDAQARFGQTRQAAGATRHQCRTVAVLPL